MSKQTLFDKVWKSHKVAELPGGKDQLYVGMHLIHEVTSPQAFDMLEEEGIKVRRPDLAVAVEDHVIPTDDRSHPYADEDYMNGIDLVIQIFTMAQISREQEKGLFRAKAGGNEWKDLSEQGKRFYGMQLGELPHSVKLTVNAKGQMSGEVKCYGETPMEALDNTIKITNAIKKIIESNNLGGK